MDPEEKKRERNRNYAKRFRDKNPEKSRESSRKWYNENKERILQKRIEDRLKKQERQELERQELERLRNVVQQYGIQV